MNRELVITKLVQPKHVVDLTDPHAPDQLAEIMLKDKMTRRLILAAFDRFTFKYCQPKTLHKITSLN